jgi:hypothetical protein
MPASFRGAGGGSVRRRNTLHVVGGREYSFSQARFMGREKIKYFIRINKIFYEKIEWLKII